MGGGWGRFVESVRRLRRRWCLGVGRSKAGTPELCFCAVGRSDRIDCFDGQLQKSGHLPGDIPAVCGILSVHRLFCCRLSERFPATVCFCC